MPPTPSYISLYETGELADRAERAREIIKQCRLCPHECNVNRIAGSTGKCRSGELPVVASFHAHRGEESVISGKNGSGTIFFSHCNLACIFCQNYDISHYGQGDEVSFKRLAEMMMELQGKGCHNINFVTPTHFVYPVLEALLIAVPLGLRIPLVYNTGGYDSMATLGLLEGIIDIYMPDFKYMDSHTSGELSSVPDYPEKAGTALREMHRQVGDLTTEKGIAFRGVLVRHLVLPHDRASSGVVMRYIADISKDMYVNIMDQYRPEYHAYECFDIKRRVTLQEYDAAVESARRAGLHRLDSRK